MTNSKGRSLAFVMGNKLVYIKLVNLRQLAIYQRHFKYFNKKKITRLVQTSKFFCCLGNRKSYHHGLTLLMEVHLCQKKTSKIKSTPPHPYSLLPYKKWKYLTIKLFLMKFLCYLPYHTIQIVDYILSFISKTILQKWKGSFLSTFICFYILLKFTSS